MTLETASFDAVFSGLDRLDPSVHFIPITNPRFLQQVTTFSFDYTGVLNLLSVVVIAILSYLNMKHPMMMHMGHAPHSGHTMASMGEEEHMTTQAIR